jgi:hypothetical protein
MPWHQLHTPPCHSFLVASDLYRRNLLLRINRFIFLSLRHSTPGGSMAFQRRFIRALDRGEEAFDPLDHAGGAVSGLLPATTCLTSEVVLVERVGRTV